MNRLSCLLLVALLATPATLATLSPRGARAAEVDVYLLGGQSNMRGLGELADLSAEEKAALPNVYFWNAEAFEPLVPGQTKTAGRAGNFGPELSFARAVAAQAGPGKAIYLIKHHASGKPLDPGWDGARWIGAEPPRGRVNFYPGLRADDPNQGKLYQAMLARYRAGIEALRAQGDAPIVRGFLWMQGEQDAKHETSAGRYALNLRLLRDRLAADLGMAAAAGLPMAFGQVLPHEPALPRFIARRTLRTKMAAADMNSGQAEAIPRCRMVSTDGFPLRDDTVHYNSRGQMLLGKALAKGLAEAVKAIDAAPPAGAAQDGH